MNPCNAFRLKTIVNISFVASFTIPLAACGDDSDNENVDLDVGVELDVDAEPDADAEEDADTDPACIAEETAQEALAPIDAVAEHDGVFTTEDGVTSGTLSAPAGGLQSAGENSWVYIDLQTGEVLEITDTEALSNEQWDLAFKRTEVRLNGGDSGPGAWFAARIEDTSWDNAPRPGRDAEYLNDNFVDDETCELITYGRDSLQTAFGQWYDYNFETHAITAPEDTIYALYTMSDHSVWRFQIEEYDSATATYTLRWSLFPAPEGN